MLSMDQIVRTLNFDAILDLVETAEATLRAHRAAFTAASAADGLETLTRALALLDRTASIRKTLAQIHATFSQPQTPPPNTPAPPNSSQPQPPSHPSPSNLDASPNPLAQFQKLLGENTDVTRELEQLITHLQKDADDPIATESVMQFIKTMDLDSLDSLDSTDPLDSLNPTNLTNPTRLMQSIGSIGSIGSLDPLDPLAPLAPLSPLSPLAPLRIPRHAASLFDFTNAAPVAPYAPPKPRPPVSSKPFAIHSPAIRAYAPRSCRVLPWEKLPHHAAEAAARAQTLAGNTASPDPTIPESPTPSTKPAQSPKSKASTSPSIPHAPAPPPSPDTS